MDAFKFPKRGVYARSTPTLQINSKVFWRWCITLVFTEFINVSEMFSFRITDHVQVQEHSNSECNISPLESFRNAPNFFDSNVFPFFMFYEKIMLYCDIHKKNSRTGKLC
jgi:hypothetical protein